MSLRSASLLIEVRSERPNPNVSFSSQTFESRSQSPIWRGQVLVQRRGQRRGDRNHRLCAAGCTAFGDPQKRSEDKGQLTTHTTATVELVKTSNCVG